MDEKAIQQTTRWLLIERAAMAAGVDLHWGSGGNGEKYPWIVGPDGQETWDPLDDDGAAFRLAVKLNLETVCDDSTTDHMPFAYARLAGTDEWTIVPVVACPLKAMRRAICECAAKLAAPAVRAA
ncbi:hypothetical protein [Roseateles sp.]|uniref:hypothetical protein n=1 Tax=Roseateles sp. TaxID=1971397 RepID=UPI003BA59D6C